MKNPLRKRLPRELKDEFGKYLVIFLFMTLTIGLVSGFLVAGKSMVKTYNDSFEEYNIEDGHFILNDEITRTLQNKLEDEEDITVYSLFYKEEEEGEHLVGVRRCGFHDPRVEDALLDGFRVIEGGLVRCLEGTLQPNLHTT